MRAKYIVASLFLLFMLAVAATPGRCAEEQPPNIDPRAEAVMKRLSDFVKGTNSLSVSVRLSPSDLKQSSWNLINVLVEKPNKVRLESTVRGKELLVISDGTIVSLYVPKAKKYQQWQNLNRPYEALSFGSYGSFFLRGFFETDPYAFFLEGVLQAEYIGEEQVQDKPCDHLRFTQKNLKWDIWIQQGEQPFPLRLLTESEKKNASTNVNVIYYDWRINPEIPQENFTFAVPADAQKAETIYDKKEPRVDETRENR